MNADEDVRIKIIGNALTLSSKTLAGMMRENEVFLVQLVNLYKKNRNKDGYKGSIYELLSEALSYRGIHQKDGKKVGADQLTTIFARLRKEKK